MIWVLYSLVSEKNDKKGEGKQLKLTLISRIVIFLQVLRVYKIPLCAVKKKKKTTIKNATNLKNVKYMKKKFFFLVERYAYMTCASMEVVAHVHSTCLLIGISLYSGVLKMWSCSTAEVLIVVICKCGIGYIVI